VHISQRLPTTINLGSHPPKKSQLLVFPPLPLPINSDSSAGIAVTSSDAEHFIVNWFSSRIRLTDQLVRPTLRHLCQRAEAAGLTWRNALATSPQFSVLLDVRRPSDGPATARVLILHGGGRVASRRPGGARPRASPWGRLRGGHTPSTRPPPGAIPGGWPSRRSARPARAWLLRSTRSSGRPSKPSDHSPETDADQRRSLIVGQRRLRYLQKKGS
jgi:hypothetical protein